MYITAGVLSFCFIASTAFCIFNYNSLCKDTSVTALEDSSGYKSLLITDSGESLYIDLGGKKSGIKTVFAHGYSKLDCYVMNSISEQDYKKLEDALTQINIKSVYIPDTGAGNAETDGIIEKIKVLANDRGCDIINFNNAIYKSTGYSSVEIKSGCKNTLAESLVVKIRRDGRSVAVYGGARTGNSNDYGGSDTVILLGSFEKPYKDIYCTEYCMKLNGGKADESVTGDVHDYSATDYISVSIIDRTEEVSTDEP